MIEKITELESLRDTILDDLEELQSIDSGSLVESSIACHLRKHKETGATFDYRCRLCVNFDKFTEYGQLIYSADKADIKEGLARTGRNRQKLKLIGDRTKFTKEEEHMALMQEEEELIKTTDHAGLITFSSEIRMWNESDLEKALKQLHTFARLTKYSDDNCSEKNGGRKTDDDIIQDGATHLKFFDMIKKEFKVLRILWTKTYDQISAVDELSQATTRLILRGNMENERPSGSKKRKLLSDWNQERDRKAATLNVVSLHDLRPKLDEINHDYITAQADFNTHIGQLFYLEHLEKRSYGKKGSLNEDECPICHNVLGHEWCVLPCGHSFCSECVKTMCPYQAHSFPCPLCRQTVKVSEVSFVDTTVSQDNMKDSEADKAIPSTSKNISRSLQEIPNVRGSHSTKVYAIVEKLLQLQVTNPGEKVLIFSAWVVVLDIIQRALDQNGIRYSGLKSSENKGKFQKALKRFKERDDIQALLLPIISGSKGLNIVEATHIFLVEPILNMGSELQAIGRVHRIGQTKPTFVHRFYVKSTIEEQLFEVLKTQDVCSDEEGLLSLGDLKQLLTK